MAESPRAGLGRRAGLLAVPLAVAGLVLAGGGTAAAATVSKSASAVPAQVTSARHVRASRLCRRPSATARVSITRTIPSRRPRSVRVTRAPKVRSLARALCALPGLPAGTECPAIASGSYRLTFTAGRVALPAVTIQDSGCQLVVGLAKVRQADKPHFWKLVKQLMVKRAAAKVPHRLLHPVTWWPHGYPGGGWCGTLALPMLPAGTWLPRCLAAVGRAGSRVWM
jgi:hypothetical protein